MYVNREHSKTVKFLEAFYAQRKESKAVVVLTVTTKNRQTNYIVNIYLILKVEVKKVLGQRLVCALVLPVT